MKKQTAYSQGALVLLVLLFVGISMVSGSVLKGFRFDLTENGLFTLSEGTGRILESLEERGALLGLLLLAPPMAVAHRAASD